jgi:hypothetical protein
VRKNNIYTMNKKIYRFDKFFEKGLTLTDLTGSSVDGKRGDTLVRKLKNKEKIRLDNGQLIDIEQMKDPDIDGTWQAADIAADNMLDDSGKFDIVKATDYLKNTKKSKAARANSYVKVFKDTDTDEEYTIGDFQKDRDFGSTGAGVRIREHESIQMMFLAKRIQENVDFPAPKMTKKTVKDRITKQMKEVKIYEYPEIRDILESFTNQTNFKIGNTTLYPAPGFKLTEDMFKHYCDDQSWLSTFSNVPNKLCGQKDKSGSLVLSPNIKYTIFHVAYKGSESTSNVIFRKYKVLSKGHAVEFSKYCPADIYIVDSNSLDTLNKGIESCKDIFELNNFLNDSFRDRQIIPVSLKRVGPSPNSATLIVNAEDNMELPTFKVSKFRLSKDMEKGIGSKIMTNSEWINNGEKIERQRNLTMDSPNTGKNSNIDGEIDGVWARHGKVSFAWIKKFIEESTLYHNNVEDAGRIMEWQQLVGYSVDELRKMLGDLQKDLIDLKSEMNISIDYDLAGREIKGNIEKKLISKIQSLQIIKALAVIDKNDRSKKEVDRIVSNMLLYALSIQNPGFSSPKYVRVI